jgi:AAHS family 4-hydroxybenzoate transporter-like MFS transporter
MDVQALRQIGTTATSFDVGRALDEGAFSRFQKAIVALLAATVIIDGFDSQLIGFAIPVIAKEWDVARAAFVPVVASGIVGMAVGGACAGLFGDRFGRRWAVIGSVILFGIATCAVGFSSNLLTLATLRFFAGLGIGGALPSATTLAAEFSPKRWRTVAVTATIVCVPLGGMIAGLFAGTILPTVGWRPLFLIGGALPLVFSGVLVAFLPESPRYLTRHPLKWQQLHALLSRFTTVPAGTDTFTDRAEQKEESHEGVRALVTPNFRRDSFALWAAFFMSMLVIYSAFSWLPTMLISAGLNTKLASAGLTSYNAGGVIGALVCAFAISRFGSRGPLLWCCAGGALSALVLTPVDFQRHPTLLIIVLGVHGLFANAVQSTLYALCAHVYPTRFRATGTAAAVFCGRTGALLSSFAASAAITHGGSFGYLVMLAVAMFLVLLSLAVVRRHSDPVVARESAA